MLVRDKTIKSKDTTKYVELYVEDLRTRVRSPPAPPKLALVLPNVNKKPLKVYSSQGFFVDYLQPLATLVFN